MSNELEVGPTSSSSSRGSTNSSVAVHFDDDEDELATPAVPVHDPRLGLSAGDEVDQDSHPAPVRDCRAVRWMLTLWEPVTEVDIRAFLDFHKDRIREAYVCADTTEDGRFHYHVAVRFNKATSVHIFRRAFGQGNHYEVTRSWIGACNYVQGKVPGHGERKQLLIAVGAPDGKLATARPSKTSEFVRSVLDGERTIDELDRKLQEPGNECFILHRKAFVEYLQALRKPRPGIQKKVCLWFCGPSGCGKSYLARQVAVAFGPFCTATFSKNGQLVGYAPESRCVLFDDLNLSNTSIPKEVLFNLFDKYDFVADTKGGSVLVDAEVMIVTRVETILQVQTVYGWSNHEVQQLYRRFNMVYCVSQQDPSGAFQYFAYRDPACTQSITVDELKTTVQGLLA